MPAFTGRDIMFEVAFGDETQDPSTLTFFEVGMCRDKSINVTWDQVETTADKSPEFTKTYLVTFKNVEVNINGVAYTDAVHNQAQVKAFIYNPPASTGGQPKAWVRQTAPDGTTLVPVIFSSWNSSGAYADAATWEASAMGNGACVFTPA